MNGPLTVDPRQTVRWAYQLLLGREPESDAAIDVHLGLDGGAAPDALRHRIMRSEEFRLQLRQAGLEVAAATSPVGPLDGMLGEPQPPRDGFFTDRFGVRTRTAYLPPAYATYAGKVGSPDGTFDMPVHEPAELSALLRAVHGAKGRFAAMELGAGWGPWIALGGHLARRRGLPVSLFGVEGSSDHVGFMRTHLADNGFDPAGHTLIHAVVGENDGTAYFPKLPDPSGDWGAVASFAAGQEPGMEQVPCVSLRTLLAASPVIDFLHCDVQGAELDVFRAAIDDIDAKVRRTCIGTHARAVEAGLLDLLGAHGWHLEHETPCSLTQQGKAMVLTADGVQVWRNPAAL